MNLQLFRNTPCFPRFKKPDTACDGMNIQIVHHQNQLSCMSIMYSNKLLDKNGKSSTFCFCLPSQPVSLQRFKSCKQSKSALRIDDTQNPQVLHYPSLPNASLLNKLLVYPNTPDKVNQVTKTGYKPCSWLGDTQLFLFPRLEFVFLVECNVGYTITLPRCISSFVILPVSVVHNLKEPRNMQLPEYIFPFHPSILRCRFSCFFSLTLPSTPPPQTAWLFD